MEVLLAEAMDRLLTIEADQKYMQRQVQDLQSGALASDRVSAKVLAEELASAVAGGRKSAQVLAEEAGQTLLGVLKEPLSRELDCEKLVRYFQALTELWQEDKPEENRPLLRLVRMAQTPSLGALLNGIESMTDLEEVKALIVQGFGLADYQDEEQLTVRADELAKALVHKWEFDPLRDSKRTGVY